MTKEIEWFLNNRVATCFDYKVAFNINANDLDNDYDICIHSDNLESQVGLGMDAYGEWNWSLHSKESKKEICDNAYRFCANCFFYEACESKPKINLNYSTDDFWKYDCSVESIKEEIDAAKVRFNEKLNK